MRNHSCLVFVFLALSGCSGMVPKEPPATAGPGAESFVLTRLPTDAEKYFSTNLPDCYFGVSGARGSVAVGILFGPLGVAGNVAYIQAENKRRAAQLTSLTSTNLMAILTSAVPGLKTGSAGNQTGYELVPAAVLHFPSDTSYYVSCILNVELASPAGPPWRSRYVVSPEGLLNANDPADMQKALSMLPPCFQRAYRLFRDHVDRKLGPFTPRLLDTEEGELTMPVADSALPHRIIWNDGFGLVEVRKGSVTGVR